MLSRAMACFAEPCHRARIRATQWLAMTVLAALPADILSCCRSLATERARWNEAAEFTLDQFDTYPGSIRCMTRVP
jgi:hypothetical protein